MSASTDAPGAIAHFSGTGSAAASGLSFERTDGVGELDLKVREQAPVQTPGGVDSSGRVWAVEQSGPTGQLKVSFPAIAGRPDATVVGRETPSGWELLPTQPDGDRVVATVDHFSRVGTFASSAWGLVTKASRAIVNAIGLGTVGAPPTCSPKAGTKYLTISNGTKTTSPDTTRVLGMEGCIQPSAALDPPFTVKLANRRSVAMFVRADGARLGKRTIPGLGDLAEIGLQRFSRLLDSGAGEGVCIPGGGNIELITSATSTWPAVLDNTGIAFELLIAIAAGDPVGPLAKAIDAASASIELIIDGANAERDGTWEQLAADVLAEVLKQTATVPGRLVGAAIATIIGAIRGTIDSLLGTFQADSTGLVKFEVPQKDPLLGFGGAAATVAKLVKAVNRGDRGGAVALANADIVDGMLSVNAYFKKPVFGAARCVAKGAQHPDIGGSTFCEVTSSGAPTSTWLGVEERGAGIWMVISWLPPTQ